MIVYDVAMKVLDTLISPAQHRWPDVWHYIYCFVSVRRSLYGGRKYTHIYTHIHTHTHTCTHTGTHRHTHTHKHTHTHAVIKVTNDPRRSKTT